MRPGPAMTRHRIGRGLELLGLMVLPYAIISELYGVVGLGQSMLIAAAGIAIFFVGVRLRSAA